MIQGNDDGDQNYPDSEEHMGQSDVSKVCNCYQQRLALLDSALDEVGEGKFQYILLLLTFMAYFSEHAEIVIIGLLYPEFLKEWNLEETQLSILSSFTAAGALFGALVFGQISDTRGRKFALQVSMLICVVFGITSSFSRNINEFAICRMFIGIGYGGSAVASAPLLLESVPSNSRGRFIAWKNFGSFAGSLFATGIGYLYLESKGWAWVVMLLAITGIPTVVGLFIYAPESIRFLILKEQYGEAIATFEKICRANSKPIPDYFTLANLEGNGLLTEGENENISRCREVTRKGVLQTLIPLVIIWFLTAFGSSIFAFFPLFIELLAAEEDVEYIVSFANILGQFLGSVFNVLIAHKLPRKVEIRMSLLAVGIGVILVGPFKDYMWAIYSLVVFTTVARSPLLHGLHTYSPEVFPTQIRVFAFSICQFVHRLGEMISPYVVTTLDEKSFGLATSVNGGIFLLACLTTFLLKIETSTSRLVESQGAEPEHTITSKNDEAVSSKQDYLPVDSENDIEMVNMHRPAYNDGCSSMSGQYIPVET